MTTELATVSPIKPPAQLMQSIEKYLESMGNKLSQKHRTQFIEIASAFQLNPFIREIYGIPYGDNFNIIVGYEVYLKRAETSGQLAGWRAWTEGEGSSIKGCVEITRRDWSAPFYHEVYLEEYDQKNSMWKSKPRTMIKKVAIAQGFRMAFPVELGGIPYTADELPGPSEEEKCTRVYEHNGPASSSKPQAASPKEKAPSNDGKLVSEAQAKMLYAKCKNKGITPEAFCAHYKIDKIQALPFSEMNPALKLIDSGEIVEVAATSQPEAPLPGRCVECGCEIKGDFCTNPECIGYRDPEGL